jgi:hypothetical protein
MATFWQWNDRQALPHTSLTEVNKKELLEKLRRGTWVTPDSEDHAKVLSRVRYEIPNVTAYVRSPAMLYR